MTPRATIDFESRSACSLRHGAWKYSLDPSTEVLCLAFRLPHWAPGRTSLWHPAFPHLDLPEGGDWDDFAELFTWIEAGGLVEAHNVLFEIAMWTNICVAKWGWPAVPLRSWRCSAAKAASHALPRALEKMDVAIGLTVVKDVEGSKTMKKMASPRKATRADVHAWGRTYASCVVCEGQGRVPSFKKDGTPTVRGVKCAVCAGLGYDVRAAVPPMPTLYHESVESLAVLFDYCRQDVLAEEALSHALPDLTPDETEVFLLDLAINVRGFGLDTDAVDAALDLIDIECADFNAELVTLTGGAVTKATQRGRMMEWLAAQGLDLDDTQADTIDTTLERVDLAPHVRRALELMRALGRSSTAKYVTMADWMCPDGRVRGGLLYHGASTGRWSGKGVQPHNFPRGTIKRFDMNEAWALLKTRDRDAIIAKYGDVMEALSCALRGALVPAPGHELFVADFAGIEARVLLWLAEDEDGLDIFRTGGDIYCVMASSIYGYPVEPNEDNPPPERKLGKVAILGLGYQMGAGKFVSTAFDLGGVVIQEDHVCTRCHRKWREHLKWERDAKKRCDCEDEQECAFLCGPKERHAFVGDTTEMTAVKVVEAYRAKFWRVKEMWDDQEAAALAAVRYPGEVIVSGRVTWHVEGRFLYCTLPSGRRLAYPDPEIHQRATPWGAMKDSLTHMGVNPLNKQWQRLTVYGGLLVENITQAVARDLMAAALLLIARSGVYQPVLSVHDEGLAEAPIGRGDITEFKTLMTTSLDWAEGLPVGASGFVTQRYRK